MIVPMSKITLLGLSSQREALLRQLMRFGCVEVTDISDASAFLSREEQQAYQQAKGGGIRYDEMRESSKETAGGGTSLFRGTDGGEKRKGRGGNHQ